MTHSSTHSSPPPRRHRRHLAVVVALAAVVAAVPGIASLAGFSARDVNRDNLITTGRLDVAFGRDTSQFRVTNMKPGDWFDTTVEIVNTGSIDQDYSFGATNLRPAGPADLDEVLRVGIERDGEQLVDGARFSTLSGVRGRLAPGGSAFLGLRVTWPESVSQIDNRYQASRLVLDLLVEAVQSDMAPTTTAPPATDPIGLNGTPGLTTLTVPHDPSRTAITVVDATSTRFSVTNFSPSPRSVRFDADGIVEVWDGSGEWIVSILFPDWGWDGHRIDLAPGETRRFIANAWEADARLSVVSLDGA